jgi:hypothetical protein
MSQEEADELHWAIAAVDERVAREATAMLVEGWVTAALAFAKANPDIPRGHWRPPEPDPVKHPSRDRCVK